MRLYLPALALLYFGAYLSSCEKKCLKNCLACERDGTCTLCKEGFYGVACDNTCPKNCQTCTNGTLCSLCIDGFYGNTCTSECPVNCVACISDTWCSKCKDGFTHKYKCSYKCRKSCKSCTIGYPFLCTECARGLYSNTWFDEGSITYSTCYSKCPKYCVHGFCNGTSGECTDGCVGGYTGSKCCSVNCRTGECDPITGYCKQCKSNFSESECQCGQTDCLDSKCTSCKNNTKCSSTCKDGLCNSDGKCSEGCIDGFYGDLCEYRCMDRDINCLLCTSNTCTKCLPGCFHNNVGICVRCSDKCISNSCNTNDGTCLESCREGYWGKQCSFKCLDLCLECDKESGVCNVCEEGRFRRTCSETCTDSCLTLFGSLTCDIYTGACKHGCFNTSKYGEFCAMNCSHTCVNAECDWKNGHCTKGCLSQYYGRFCQNKCTRDKCGESVLDEGTPVEVMLIVLYSALSVIALTGIIVAAVFCVMRRRRRQESEQLPSSNLIAMGTSEIVYTQANPRQQPATIENEESSTERIYECVDNMETQYEALNDDGQQPSDEYQSIATEERTNTSSDSKIIIDAQYLNLKL